MFGWPAFHNRCHLYGIPYYSEFNTYTIKATFKAFVYFFQFVRGNIYGMRIEMRKDAGNSIAVQIIFAYRINILFIDQVYNLLQPVITFNNCSQVAFGA